MTTSNPVDVAVIPVDPEEDWDLADAAEALMRGGPLRAMRNRELRYVAVQESNSPYPKVVGSMWDAVTDEGEGEGTRYTFDIDVDAKLDPARRYGVFKRLLAAAMDTFTELQEPYPELYYDVWVVHPFARAVLEREGFEVTTDLGNEQWMMTRSNPRYGASTGKLRFFNALLDAGLKEIAGGTKYAYFGLPGTPKGPGYFLRLGARAARLVHRVRLPGYGGRKGKIEDNALGREFYYGKIKDPERTAQDVLAFLRKKQGGSLAQVVDQQLEQLLEQVKQGEMDTELLGDFIVNCMEYHPSCADEIAESLNPLLADLKRGRPVIWEGPLEVARELRYAATGFCGLERRQHERLVRRVVEDL